MISGTKIVDGPSPRPGTQAASAPYLDRTKGFISANCSCSVDPSSAVVEATREVLQQHGGLWFYDESFVISRRQP